MAIRPGDICIVGGTHASSRHYKNIVGRRVRAVDRLIGYGAIVEEVDKPYVGECLKHRAPRWLIHKEDFLRTEVIDNQDALCFLKEI